MKSSIIFNSCFRNELYSTDNLLILFASHQHHCGNWKHCRTSVLPPAREGKYVRWNRNSSTWPTTRSVFFEKKSSCCGHSKQANWASKRLGPQLPDVDVAMRHFQALKISEKNYIKKTRKNWTNPQKPWNTWKTLGQVIQVHAVQHNTKHPKRTPLHICSIGVFNMFLDVLSSPSIFLGSLRVA